MTASPEWKQRVEQVSRAYVKNQDASNALGLTYSQYLRICRQLRIPTAHEYSHKKDPPWNWTVVKKDH